MSSMLRQASGLYQRVMYGKDHGTTKTSFLELVDKDMKGAEVAMSTFKGSILCIVNVASK